MSAGSHFIAGTRVAGVDTFTSSPVAGEGRAYSCGTPEHVEVAVAAAETAFEVFGAMPIDRRAGFLRRIAAQIEARGAALTEIGCAETGLPEARLEGERGRTIGQLNMFADDLESGRCIDTHLDEAMPERIPPRPELRMVQRPVGPVAVFGAANFPLAFSVAGGDTASALAAGCPVVVKGHPAHPGTSELVAEAIQAAADDENMPRGVFSLIQDAGHEVGLALVRHPLIRAVGFTGSYQAGKALYDVCASRAEPIPFYGELGSINPMFLLPSALARRGKELGEDWAASLTMGAGQFCTNPGVAFVVDNDSADTFVASARAALANVPSQPMLTEGIAHDYDRGVALLGAVPGVTPVWVSPAVARGANPDLFETTAEVWQNVPDLAQEVFGPVGIVVRVADTSEMQAIARKLDGQLTCTLHLESEDIPCAQKLVPILERKAGRVLANGFPTGVEVCGAMVHGGPFPASTNFGATSVGSQAIRRWLRPVCLQNFPPELLGGSAR